MRLLCDGNQTGFEFENVPLIFKGARYTNIFAQKNNKTVAQTLAHPRYSKFQPEIMDRYAASLDTPLGTFLLRLKHEQDQFYTRFLNRYGDLEYSVFFITEDQFLRKKGVYAYISGEDIKYIGRCKDSLKKRINQGYGKIHPKNCYLDGQATNCHLNALITGSREDISLWLCPMDDEREIVTKEHRLIRSYQPPWNIQRP